MFAKVTWLWVGFVTLVAADLRTACAVENNQTCLTQLAMVGLHARERAVKLLDGTQFNFFVPFEATPGDLEFLKDDADVLNGYLRVNINFRTYDEFKAANPEMPISIREFAAIHLYTTNDHEPINIMLRDGVADAKYQNSLIAKAKVIASGLHKLPRYEETVYRWAQMPGVSEFKVGQEMRFSQFLSCSTKDDLNGFAHNVKFIIHGKSGRLIQAISAKPSEGEVLFLPGTVLRFDSVTTDKGIVVVEATEIIR